MRVALVGGGGFRAPMVVDALARTGVVDEVVLHDVNAARLDRIAAVLEGAGRETALDVEVATETDLSAAIGGASFVLLAIRVGGLAGRVIDESVPLSVGVLGQETVGAGGIAYALRTIPVVRSIADVIADRAPDATVINLTNPAGVVTEVLRERLGASAIGICDSPSALRRHVAAAIGAREDELRVDHVGLNHLGWITAVERRGVDELPRLLDDDERLAAIHEVELLGVDEVRASGALPNEYLVYYRRTDDIVAAFRRDGPRGAALERQQARFFEGPVPPPAEALASWRRARDERHATYLAEARAPTDASASPNEQADAATTVTSDDPSVGLGGTSDELGYSEVAAEVIRSAVAPPNAPGGEPILEVRNGGRVGWLDDDATIEVPCAVVGRTIEPRGGRSPGPGERALAARVREAERLTIAAAGSRRRVDVLDAFAAHPTIDDRDVAARILAGYLERHRWLRDGYA